jgi:ribosomal protein L14
MFFKNTRVTSFDRSGVGVAKTIHPYQVFGRFGRVGSYLKASVRSLIRLPARIRGKRFRPIRVGFVVRGITMSSRFKSKLSSTVALYSTSSAMVLIKRRGFLRSKHIFGFVQRPRFSKKF